MPFPPSADKNQDACESGLFGITGVQHSDFKQFNCLVGGLTRKGVTRGYAVALLPSSCFQDADSSADESSVMWFYQSAETNLDKTTTFLNFTAVNFVFGYQCRSLNKTS